jgi:hypothetical protein
VPPTDQTALRGRIAKALARTELKPPYPHCLAMADAVLAELPAPAEEHRLALSDALGLGTGAPWDAIHDRATELGLPPLDQDPVARRLGLLAAPADRAAVLDEAADAVFALDYDVMVGEVGDENLGSMREAWDVGTIHAMKLLRHLAAEARGAQQDQAHADRPDGWTTDQEIHLLRLTANALEESRKELRAEAARMRAQLWTLGAALDGMGRLLATSSRDWGQYAPDAWLWAVLCGWDCEEAHDHDDDCGGAMEEMAARHGWDEATVAKARHYRAAVHVLTKPAAELPAGGTPHGEEAPLCDGCGHPEHVANECPVTQYGERCPCDEPVAAEAQQDGARP